MRPFSALAIALLLAAVVQLLRPAAADEAPVAAPPHVFAKISLSRIDADSLMRLMYGKGPEVNGAFTRLKPGEKPRIPAGIDGVLGYPLDNSILVQGQPRAIDALRAGIKLVDAKVETRGTIARVVLNNITATRIDALRDAVLSLPGAGFADRSTEGVTLTGSLDWIRESMGEAFEQEIVAATK